MSAVLRASGVDFDVDGFLKESRLAPCAVHRRGEPVFPASQPTGRLHERSRVHVAVSEAAFEEFSRQVEDAITFLGVKREEVRRLMNFPGVEAVVLDFGVSRRDVLLECYFLPPELIQRAGELGLGVELSQYPAEEGGENQRGHTGTIAREGGMP
jgi:hypothetical protein